MKTNKLVLVIAHLWQGGGERVCTTLANEFAAMGYEVDVVVFNLEKAVFDKELDDKVNLHNLNAKNNFESILGLYSYLKKNDSVTVLSFNFHASFFLSLLKKLLKFKLISRSLNTLSKELKGSSSFAKNLKLKMITFGLSNSDLVISQSKGMKEDLLSFNVNNVEVINNPINPKYLEVKDYKKEKYILFVGRLSKQKGLDYLLEALKSINPDYKLYIIGSGESIDDVKQKINALSLIDRVKILGQKTEIAEYYSKASCTILSSIYEGFPNVLIESIACGTPVVSFDCPNGPSEIVVDGINGKLATYLDSDDLASKVNWALSNSFNSSEVKKTIRCFHPQIIAKEFLEVIEDA